MARQDAFTRAYIEAALWSTNDESDESGGEPLDKNYGPGDIAAETMELIEEDCADFQKRYGHLIEDDDSPRIEKEGRWELAGYHFWLTREGHGAGFWDGDWPKHGDELTEAARSYGPFELYVGDDGEIYGPPPDQYRHPPEWLAKRHPSRGRGGRSEESHHVADFSTLEEIIEHAQQVDGATHVLAAGKHTQIFFPIAGGSYETSRVWRESGYWHSEAPSDRVVVDRLPGGAEPIESFLARSKGESRSRYQPPHRQPEVHEAIHGYNIEVVYPDERFARKHESAVGHMIQKPLVSQGALRDGYRMEYGPIERDEYRHLEGLIYTRLGNAVRVRLVQVAYAGGRSDESRRRAPSRERSRFPRRRR